MDVATGLREALAAIGLTFLLVWLGVMIVVGGLPAAWLASERGREPFIWLFVGVVLGPLAPLLVGLAPIAAGGRFGPCRRCAEPVRREATRWPHCAWEDAGPWCAVQSSNRRQER
jgi:hypothetical protein